MAPISAALRLIGIGTTSLKLIRIGTKLLYKSTAKEGAPANVRASEKRDSFLLLSSMNVVVQEIRKIEQSAFRDYGIPTLLLMENAGRSVSDIISAKYPPCRVLVFAGKGNNGGDGFVVARHLSNRGYSVRMALLADPAELKADSLLNFSILDKMGIPSFQVDGVSDEELSDQLHKAELVVDAIFGIGIHRAVSGFFLRAIHAINASQRPVVSIDIPSGLDADTGQVHGIAVRATRTVTLALPKKGLFVGEGPRYAGEIEVADIGIPKKLLAPYLD